MFNFKTEIHSFHTGKSQEERNSIGIARLRKELKRRKRQNLCNNNVFSAESSFNAKTSGNQATADHVMPTGGRCQHRAPRTFGDTSYYNVMEIHTGNTN